MSLKVKDLTVEQFQSLISKAIKEAVEDVMEDVLALSSKGYLNSIKEARNDYEKEDYKHLEDIS